ncbi:MAG: FAD-dependent oxidoreductase [Candidatus Moranbacteria bacterium]|nr:FAD-dependent oxidoreductase [Candidatus Moranbacteria bacterium]
MLEEIAFHTKEEVAENTFLYTFSKPQGYVFQAGQYATLRFHKKTPHQDDRGNARCFSFASAPYEETLSFMMRQSESGFKKNMFDAKKGERMQITSAQGRGTFEVFKKGKQLVMICAGVGVTPMRSILRQSVYEKSNFPLVLINSNRNKRSTPELEWLEGLSQRFQNIQVINTLTDNDDEAWQGSTKRIDDVMIRSLVSDTPQTFYFVAAGISFVQAIEKILFLQGISKERIYFDSFG